MINAVFFIIVIVITSNLLKVFNGNDKDSTAKSNNIHKNIDNKTTQLNNIVNMTKDEFIKEKETDTKARMNKTKNKESKEEVIQHKATGKDNLVVSDNNELKDIFNGFAASDSLYLLNNKKNYYL